MVTRDRFHELTAKIAASRVEQDEHLLQTEGLLTEVVVVTFTSSSENAVSAELDEFLNRVRLQILNHVIIHHLHQLIQELEFEVGKVESLQRQILLEADESEPQAKLDNVKVSIKAKVIEIRTARSDLYNHLVSTADEWNTSENELDIRKRQYSIVSERFKDVQMQYLETQIKFVEEQEALLNDFCVIDLDKISELEAEDAFEIIEMEHGPLTVKMSQKTRLQSRDSNSKAYHDAVVKLEKSVTELHALFNEMADLVNDQYGKLDIIREKVVFTQETVSKAERKLSRARRYQLKVIKKKTWIVAAAMFISLLVLILLINCMRIFLGS